MEYIKFRCSPGEYLFYFIPKLENFQSNSGNNGAMLAEFESGNQYTIEIGPAKDLGLLFSSIPGGSFVQNADLNEYTKINSFKKVEK